MRIPIEFNNRIHSYKTFGTKRILGTQVLRHPDTFNLENTGYYGTLFYVDVGKPEVFAQQFRKVEPLALR